MADKLIVVSALTVLLAQHSMVWLTLPGLIIIGREIMISALREWMAEMNSSVTAVVSYLGKIKTSLQMIAIAVLGSTAQFRLWSYFCGIYLVVRGCTNDSLVYVGIFTGAWLTLRQGLRQLM